MFRTLWEDEEGLTTVEYILLLALLAFAAIAVWAVVGGTNEPSSTAAAPSG